MIDMIRDAYGKFATATSDAARSDAEALSTRASSVGAGKRPFNSALAPPNAGALDGGFSAYKPDGVPDPDQEAKHRDATDSMDGPESHALAGEREALLAIDRELVQDPLLRRAFEAAVGAGAAVDGDVLAPSISASGSSSPTMQLASGLAMPRAREDRGDDSSTLSSGQFMLMQLLGRQVQDADDPFSTGKVPSVSG